MKNVPNWQVPCLPKLKLPHRYKKGMLSLGNHLPGQFGTGGNQGREPMARPEKDIAPTATVVDGKRAKPRARARAKAEGNVQAPRKEECAVK